MTVNLQTAICESEMDTVAVLFSGGTDSTLAAAMMLKEARKVVLLTFDPGYVFFLENTKVLVRELKRLYGEDRVEQRFLDLRPINRRILMSDIKGDLLRYGFSMASLVCLGCRLGMHAAAIIHNLENGIPYLADGSIRVQSDIPEQLESTVETTAQHYLEHYGLVKISPIYEEARSDLVLAEMGMERARGQKKHFILYDGQGTCVFGVPADVYARIFYKPIFMGDTREKDAAQYSGEKFPLMRRVIEEHFQKRGLDLEELIARNRQTVEYDRKVPEKS